MDTDTYLIYKAVGINHIMSTISQKINLAPFLARNLEREPMKSYQRSKQSLKQKVLNRHNPYGNTECAYQTNKAHSY